ncbi:MAG: adenosylcobinamide amidohydrolase [Haloarculaceae archaeon]
MFEVDLEGDVLTLARPDTTWLSTGWRGGFTEATCAHWCTVAEGWNPPDVAADVRERLAAVGIDWSGEPVLLTGVDVANARAARFGDVVAYVTAGLSNPATLPMNPTGGDLPDGEWTAGTVNVAVGTPTALTRGALANLVAVAAEAKATTLASHTGFPGTTTDAVLVASGGQGSPAPYTGAATRIGAAARACVREAVTAALAARYDDSEPPPSVDAADHGVVTDVQARVFDPTAPK